MLTIPIQYDYFITM